MKKKKIIITILITILLSIISYITFLFITVFRENKVNSNNPVYHLEKDFEIDFEDVNLINELDDRGFFGDGTLYQVIDLSNQNDEIIKELSNWDVFKVEDYRNIMEINDNNEIIFIHDSTVLIPSIKNGLAKFINRNIDDPGWEYSHNYSLAIYDKDNNLLYYIMENS